MKAALESFDSALTQPCHGARLRTVRYAAQAVRERLLDEPCVQAVRTLPLARLPYPARFAFQGAAWSPAPLVQMTHRCLFGGRGHAAADATSSAPTLAGDGAR